MRGFLAAAAALLLSASAQAQSIAGDWIGDFTISPSLVRNLAVHIQATPDGFAGTLDSVGEGNYDMPLTDIKLTGEQLGYAVPAVKAEYRAHWDAASGRWLGQWLQPGNPPREMDMAPGVRPPHPTIEGLDGDWDGAIDTKLMGKLRVAFHFATGPHGTIGKFDSIDQQVNDLPVTLIGREGDAVQLEIGFVRASFAGTLDPAKATLAGTWSQLGFSLPLALTRRAEGVAQPTLNRPQTPLPPFPYQVETVSFPSKAAGVTLAGTLTLPTGPGPFPAAVLIAGSGPNTRDEPIVGHQIFLVLADHLTRHGIAVLRYDKRGTGQSTGDYDKATTQDFADDAEAALDYLAQRKEVEPHHAGLIGHSEGGLIAPMVAARDKAAAFVVALAGPGVNGADILKEQGRLILAATGMPPDELEADTRRRNQAIDIVRDEKDPAAAAAKLRVALLDTAKTDAKPEEAVQQGIQVINTDWFRFFFNYDPAPAWHALTCPVLALIGSKDLQVPPEQNLPALRAALAGNPRVEIDEMPGLNHLFQTASTGSPMEYGRIEETMAPAALDKVADWVRRQAE